MARKKKAAGVEKVRGNWSAAEIENLLRLYHRVGAELVGLPVGRGPAADGARGVAEREGLNPNRAREFRRFAAAYSPADLEVLLALRTPQGTPPGWGVVRQLMAVKHKGKRKSLQKRAVAEGWSAERTAAAVRGEIAGGVLASGGRPLARPTDVRDALRQVGRHGGEWLRRCGVWSAIDTLIRSKLPAGGEPSLVKAEMAETRRVLRAVARASLELEGILKRVERTAASGPAAKRPGGGAMRTGDRRKER